MDIGLIVSHDALHYREPIPDFKIIPAREERDQRLLTPWVPELYTSGPHLMQGQGFENVGEKTYAWYSGWTRGMLRLATWPRDRLGYFEVNREPTEGQRPGYIYSHGAGDLPFDAHFVSSPIHLDRAGRRVFVNADGLSDATFLKVEVLDERFRPIADFSGRDVAVLKTSGLRQPVAWPRRESLEHFAHPVRLRVNFAGTRLDGAKVFAIYVA
jgi:hypothetical protein